ncbi:MAG: sigma-70 family RNA polymerase sigma factor [bacterium]|nr:sigma-70 family RNA polymerase sigma factor [bacterium]
MSDIDELILACKANESWAQEKLFKLFGPKMLGICRRYLVSLDDAKDAMQDGFVKIFTNLHKYEGRSSFNTWITRIMMNTAIDSVKKLNKVQFVSDDYYFNDGGEEEYVEAPQLSQDQLLALIDKMPAGYKMVFNMYAIDGLGHKEIGIILGISEGTSKSQLNRARTYLKTEIIKLEQTIG